MGEQVTRAGLGIILTSFGGATQGAVTSGHEADHEVR